MKSYLQHHGILGQKWGVRRYQNEDGSLTEEGIKRYTSSSRGKRKLGKMMEKDASKMLSEQRKVAQSKSSNAYSKATDYADKHGLDYDDIVDDDVTTEAGRKRAMKSMSEYGVDKKTAQHIIEYNRLTRLAEIEEEKYFKEARDNVNKDLMKKYGGFGIDDIKRLKRAGTMFDPDLYKSEDLQAEIDARNSKRNTFVSTQKNRPNMGYDNDRERKNKQLQNAGIKRKTW